MYSYTVSSQPRVRVLDGGDSAQSSDGAQAVSRDTGVELSPEAVKTLYPGLWHVLHLAGSQAVDEQGIIFFSRIVDMYCNSFPCKKCREHIREFRKNHPLSSFVGVKGKDGRRIGMAQWTWLLHNSVNVRLGKPQMSWDTFERIWLTPLDNNKGDFNAPSCSKNCSK